MNLPVGIFDQREVVAQLNRTGPRLDAVNLRQSGESGTRYCSFLHLRQDLWDRGN